MDKQIVTVVVKEYRNGTVTEKTVTYVRYIESVKRFNETWERRNRVSLKG